MTASSVPSATVHKQSFQWERQRGTRTGCEFIPKAQITSGCRGQTNASAVLMTVTTGGASDSPLSITARNTTKFPAARFSPK